ncbi:DUF308 domain-containing protein [Kutzneria buriramensis]|uniref:DUF308 domain-containing protein n=1 Tax=Kutzneria buriramensis TaxID=1045776 RepID=A0A3E0HQK7_9PSEU|nr:DUF308 domain-containing protein [Kutzneria buriramensis]REH48698.1 hypothetical protein BCF44_105558 [Kutzneria buriramensis]
MTGRGNTDGPEDVDAAFAEIVAGLERDGMGMRWPEDQPATRQDTSAAEETRPLEPQQPAAPQPPPAGWRTPEKEWDWAAASDEEHYVPPDPPPFPRPRPLTVLAVVLIVIGIGLLVAPGLIGLDAGVATPLAIIALTSGVGWLLLRMRHGPPPGSDDGSGAQL